MLKKLKSVDVIYLVIFAGASIVTLSQSLLQGYLLSLNNYAAFVILIAVLILRKIQKDGFKVGVAILLILSTFNITNYFVGQTNINIGSGEPNAFAFNTPGIEPVWLLLLIIYCFLKVDQIKLLLNGSQSVQIDEKEKLIAFYYDRFSQCHPDEYKAAIENIEKYPEEAQLALQRLASESVRTIDTAIETDKH
jgi:hypothetical protein